MAHIELSSVSAQGLVDRGVRWAMRLIPNGWRARRAPARGAGRAAISPSRGLWLAGTEQTKQQLFAEHVRPGGVLMDIGAGTGFYSVLGSRLVGREGRVYAFEASPANVESLRERVSTNRLRNVRVIDVAVGEGVGDEVLDAAAQGGVAASGSGAQDVARVRVMGIDEEMGRFNPPSVMRIDVNGAALRVLRGAQRTIEAARPTLFVTTHGRDMHDVCVSWLRERGYECEPMGPCWLRTGDEILAVSR